LDVNFCVDEIKSIGLFNATPCEMEESMNQMQDLSQLPPCHRKKILEEANEAPKNGINQRQCCHNESFNFEANPDIEPIALQEVDLTHVNAVMFILLLTLTYSNLKYSLNSTKITSLL
jgi:hypothetical protein